MSKDVKIPFKYCLVPCCTSTTVNTPEKLFFCVPYDKLKRKAWTDAMKRDDKKNPALSTKTTHWCCEDHFELEKDMENYWQWRLTSDVKRLKLNSNVVPHRFDCQRKTLLPQPERKGALKRKRIALVEEALSAAATPTTSKDESSTLYKEASTSTFDIKNGKERGIQANAVQFRSKETNTNVVKTSDIACSPIKIFHTSHTEVFHTENSFDYTCSGMLNPEEFKIEEEILSDSSCDFNGSSDTSENFSSDEDVRGEEYKKHMLKGTFMSIEKNPRLFLGLPMKSYFLIQMITEEVPLPTRNIYIVLKKLRLNNQFSILAIDFGLSISTTSRIFLKSVPVLAQLMQDFIVWPTVEDIRVHLPIPFRARYCKVTSIIDCLEIEIEKPSDPLHQSLTWSQYYDCNTLKFLISCTPDGLVNFISESYGGRTTDVRIVEDSGYLDKLIPGTSVMADRGFNHISSLFQQKGCTLVRPPSVSTACKSSKADVKLSKQIASLRVHVERVIGRLREFKMLGPHSCLDNHLIPYLDYLMIIACGIINMQDHLIKKQV